MYPAKVMYKNVYNSIICINLNLETTQIYINRRMDKQIVIHPLNGLLLNNEKEQLTAICNSVDESHNG